MASCRPRPMTWAATSSRGIGRDKSLAAACMHLTIVDVESINVPSQSKTIKSNCFLAMCSGPLPQAGSFSKYLRLVKRFPQAYQESLAFGGQWRVQRHDFAGIRMGKRNLMGVQKHAL